MSRRPPAVLALGAIALWTSVAALAVSLKSVPPFLLVGAPTLIAGMAAAPTGRSSRIPPSTLLVGVYGLFGFHLLLFTALRLVPNVEANLINYLWPLLIAVLSQVLLAG